MIKSYFYFVAIMNMVALKNMKIQKCFIYLITMEETLVNVSDFVARSIRKA